MTIDYVESARWYSEKRTRRKIELEILRSHSHTQKSSHSHSCSEKDSRYVVSSFVAPRRRAIDVIISSHSSLGSVQIKNTLQQSWGKKQASGGQRRVRKTPFFQLIFVEWPELKITFLLWADEVCRISLQNSLRPRTRSAECLKTKNSFRLCV